VPDARHERNLFEAALGEAQNEPYGRALPTAELPAHVKEALKKLPPPNGSKMASRIANGWFQLRF
jgi:hypothetical protein